MADSVDPDLMWGHSLAGLFQSNDGGRTWSLTPSRIPFPRDILPDPQTAGRAYTTSGIAVFLTEDFGRTWQDCSRGLRVEVSEIGSFAMSPGQPGIPGTVFALSPTSLFRSPEGSCQWERVPEDGLIVPLFRVVNAESGELWAGTPFGLFAFDQETQSWSEIAPESEIADVTLRVIRFDLRQQGRIWAGSRDGLLFRSDDAGDTWMRVAEEVPLTLINQIVFDPNDPLALYVADGSDLFRTGDEGETWENLTEDLDPFSASSVVVDSADSDILTLGSAINGVFRSQDGGETWTQSIDGFHTINVGSLAPAPSNPDRVYIGTLGGGLLRSEDGGESWAQIFPEVAPISLNDLSVDPADETLILAAASGGVYRSQDSGDTWTQVFDEFNASGLHRVRNMPQTVLATGSRFVAISQDGGATWESFAVSPDTIFLETVSTPADTADTIFAAGAASVFRSSNGGQDWETVVGPIPFEAEAVVVPDIRWVHVSPSDPQVVMASGSAGFFRSRDGGDAWKQVNEFIGDFVIDPQDSDHLFNFGVGESFDGGTSFQPVTEGLESLSALGVEALAFDSDGQLLAAAEGGVLLRLRGQERLRFPFFTIGDVAGQPNTSRLFIFNRDTATDLQIEARAGDGQPLGNAFPALDDSLQPFQVETVLSDSQGSLQIGSFSLFSDAPLQASLLFDGTLGMAGFSGASPTMGGFFGSVAPFQNSSQENRRASISVSNFSQEQVHIDLQLRNFLQDLLGTASLTLEAGQLQARFLDELNWLTPAGEPLDVSNLTATLHAQSSGLAKIVMLETLPGDLAEIPTIREPFNPAPADLQPLEDPLAAGRRSTRARTSLSPSPKRSAFLPQVVNGGGLQTRIFLYNPLPSSEIVEIAFWDEEGNPVALDVEGFGPVSELEVSLEASLFRVLRTTGQGQLTVASAEIRQRGLSDFWSQLTGPGGSTADRPAPVIDAPFRFPARVNASEQADTGVAVHNTSQEPNLLALELLDDEGEALATAEIALAARGRVALLASEIEWQSEQPLDFSDFLGGLRIVPEQAVAATVIQVRPGRLGKIPLAVE
ncbi:MAG TPA: YCF48-related protein [Acidobacteriota bacterium]|nr:YCF48-related protein [Acidobacteriota bacterium]